MKATDVEVEKLLKKTQFKKEKKIKPFLGENKTLMPRAPIKKVNCVFLNKDELDWKG